jgi:hypothetical protein
MVNSSVKNWRGCHGSHFARLPGNVCRPGAGRVRVNTLILMRLPEIPYCSTPHVIDTDVVLTGDYSTATWFTTQADTFVGPIRFNELSAHPGYSWIPSWTFSQPSFPSVSWRVSSFLLCDFFVLST